LAVFLDDSPTAVGELAVGVLEHLKHVVALAPSARRVRSEASEAGTPRA
jgi:hypothetical protein